METRVKVDVESRIERVVNGLLVETALENQWALATLQDRMAYYHTPGVSVAVIDDYSVAWARGFGVRDRGTNEPVTERTLFQAASISKPIFALAVMRLVERGTLDLDADVNEYLRTWRIPPNDGWQPRVTLRQILTHSAGLTVHGFAGYRHNEALPTVRQILDGEPPANSRPVRVNVIPGTRHRYSGGGTTVGQQLVVDVLGKPFPEIMRELVLEPLGLQDSTFEQPLPPHRHDQAATGHLWKGDPIDGKWHVYPEMAPAGLWTTPSDLARIGVALQRTRRGDAVGFLRRETVEQMLTPQIEDSMGLGFFLHGAGEGLCFGHGGGNSGFLSDAVFYGTGGKGVVVMINSEEGEALIPEIIRGIARAYGWTLYLGKEQVAASVAPEVVAGYAGVYGKAPGLRCRVEHTDGRLLLYVGDQPPLPLQPESETTFCSTVVNLQAIFEKPGDGEAAKLVLVQEGQRTELDAGGGGA